MIHRRLSLPVRLSLAPLALALALAAGPAGAQKGAMSPEEAARTFTPMILDLVEMHAVSSLGEERRLYERNFGSGTEAILRGRAYIDAAHRIDAGGNAALALQVIRKIDLENYRRIEGARARGGAKYFFFLASVYAQNGMWAEAEGLIPLFIDDNQWRSFTRRFVQDVRSRKKDTYASYDSFCSIVSEAERERARANFQRDRRDLKHQSHFAEIAPCLAMEDVRAGRPGEALAVLADAVEAAQALSRQQVQLDAAGRFVIGGLGTARLNLIQALSYFTAHGVTAPKTWQPPR